MVHGFQWLGMLNKGVMNAMEFLGFAVFQSGNYYNHASMHLMKEVLPIVSSLKAIHCFGAVVS